MAFPGQGRPYLSRPMTLPQVLQAFGETPAARRLVAELPGRGATLRLGGLPGSSPAVLATWIATQLPGRLLVIVAPTPAEADRWFSDLTALAPALGAGTEFPLRLYPQREALGEEEPHFEIAGERTETLEALLRGALRILVTTARATGEQTRVPAALRQLRLELRPAGVHPMRETIAALERMGYRRVPMVGEVAEFSVRGGIIDVYGFGMRTPARLEWWGDVLESARSFDLTTQRSGEGLEGVSILPIRVPSREDTDTGPEERATLLDLLPGDALVTQEVPHADQEEITRAWREAAHHLEVARRMGEDVPAREALLLAPER